MVALLMCSFSVSAYAENIKIGLVDFQRALNEVEEGKVAKAGLKSQFESKQQALNAKQESLKKLKESIEAQQAALSAEAMRQKEAQYRDQFLDLQKTLAEFRQEMATKEAELTQSIVTKLRLTVQKIGSQDGYSLIFEKSQDTVLYAPQATDITTKVIQAYNSGK
jgi:outer membrane protein